MANKQNNLYLPSREELDAQHKLDALEHKIKENTAHYNELIEKSNVLEQAYLAREKELKSQLRVLTNERNQLQKQNNRSSSNKKQTPADIKKLTKEYQKQERKSLALDKEIEAQKKVVKKLSEEITLLTNQSRDLQKKERELRSTHKQLSREQKALAKDKSTEDSLAKLHKQIKKEVDPLMKKFLIGKEELDDRLDIIDDLEKKIKKDRALLDYYAHFFKEKLAERMFEYQHIQRKIDEEKNTHAVLNRDKKAIHLRAKEFSEKEKDLAKHERILDKALKAVEKREKKLAQREAKASSLVSIEKRIKVKEAILHELEQKIGRKVHLNIGGSSRSEKAKSITKKEVKRVMEMVSSLMPSHLEEAKALLASLPTERIGDEELRYAVLDLKTTIKMRELGL